MPPVPYVSRKVCSRRKVHLTAHLLSKATKQEPLTFYLFPPKNKQTKKNPMPQELRFAEHFSQLHAAEVRRSSE